jgi:hypothetical protein
MDGVSATIVSELSTVVRRPVVGPDAKWDGR